MGATDPAKADAGTMRKEFAQSIERNATHGSDAPGHAAYEIGYFFEGVDSSRDQTANATRSLVAFIPMCPSRPLLMVMVWADAGIPGSRHRRPAAWWSCSACPSGDCPATSTFGGGAFSFYFPLTTSIVLSILLTLVLAFFRR